MCRRRLSFVALLALLAHLAAACGDEERLVCRDTHCSGDEQPVEPPDPSAIAPALDCPASVELVYEQGTPRTGVVRCTNPTEAPFTAEAVAEGRFSVLSQRTPVAALGAVEFQLLPDELPVPGVQRGRLFVDGPAGRLAEIQVDVRYDPGPVIACEPFPPVTDGVVGQASTLTTICTNVGNEDAERIELETSGPVISVAGPNGRVRIGESFEVEASVVPQSTTFAGEVVVVAWPGGRRVRLPIAFDAGALPTCEVRIEPEGWIDFLNVGLHDSWVRDVVLRFETSCHVRDVRLEGDTPVFYLPNARDFSAAPGEVVRLPVVFAPTTAGSFAGTLRFRVDDPVDEWRSVPLRGRGAASCFAWSGDNFGMAYPGCMQLRKLYGGNRCDQEITVYSVEPVETVEPVFGLVAPFTPTTLQPGEWLVLDAYFAPPTLGDFHQGFVVEWSGSYGPTALGTSGTGHLRPVWTEFFKFAPPAEARFELQHAARSGTNPVVIIDDEAVPGIDQHGGRAWSYLPEEQALVFEPGSLPDEVVAIVVQYEPACIVATDGATAPD